MIRRQDPINGLVRCFFEAPQSDSGTECRVSRIAGRLKAAVRRGGGTDRAFHLFLSRESPLAYREPTWKAVRSQPQAPNSCMRQHCILPAVRHVMQ